MVPNFFVLKDSQELARKALDIFIVSLERSLIEKKHFCFAISGGSTPKRFFELIASDKKANILSWEKIHIFWVDERCVPPGSDQSNYKLAAETFLNKIAIPRENIHRIIAEGGDIESMANAYEQIIRSIFCLKEDQLPQFDLIMLGLGEDGHTASLFPNSPAIKENQRLAVAVDFERRGIDRITLTAPVLIAADKIVVMVEGESKAGILKTVLTSKEDANRYPIHILRPVLNKVIWLVDECAAAYLK